MLLGVRGRHTHDCDCRGHLISRNSMYSGRWVVRWLARLTCLLDTDLSGFLNEKRIPKVFVLAIGE